MSRYQKGTQQYQQQQQNQQRSQSQDDILQGNLLEKTNLIQLYSDNPSEGPRLISQSNSQGVPIMVIPDPVSCCYCKLNIPEGMVCIEHNWGKNVGRIKPGCHCCYPSSRRIAAMISKNRIIFKTAIYKMHTKDNVSISLDVGITFHIGQEATLTEDCERFLYYLGPNKLQELLEQECEEKVRMFVRKQKVTKIRDVKEEIAHEVLHDLNERFNGLGVYFDNVAIINIIVPRDLREALQQTTAFDVHLQQQIKRQQYEKIKLNNEENITLLNLQRDNKTKLAELVNKLKLEQIYLEKQTILAETKQKEEIIQAQQRQSVQLLKANGIKQQAQNRAEKQAGEIVASAQAYAKARMIEAFNLAQISESQAQTRLQVAQQKSNALITEAEAENNFSPSLQNMRIHEERMKMNEAVKQMIRSNQIILSGKIGEDFISFFKDTADLLYRDPN